MCTHPCIRSTAPALPPAFMQPDLNDPHTALLAHLSPLSTCTHATYLPAGTQLRLHLAPSEQDEVRRACVLRAAWAAACTHEAGAAACRPAPVCSSRMNHDAAAALQTVVRMNPRP